MICVSLSSLFPEPSPYITSLSMESNGLRNHEALYSLQRSSPRYLLVYCSSPRPLHVRQTFGFCCQYNSFRIVATYRGVKYRVPSKDDFCCTWEFIQLVTDVSRRCNISNENLPECLKKWNSLFVSQWMTTFYTHDNWSPFMQLDFLPWLHFIYCMWQWRWKDVGVLSARLYVERAVLLGGCAEITACRTSSRDRLWNCARSKCLI
jgi:hypothetical protein